jgi:hypothetical protein
MGNLSEHRTLTYRDGSKYVGEFKDELPHGHGTATFASGDKYVGEFEDGLPHGQGVQYHLAENQFKGDKYVGEFKDGKFNGHGVYTKADGRVIQKGTWVYDEFLE